MRSVIDNRSLLDADWPPTDPERKVKLDKDNLGQFAKQFAHASLFDAILIAKQLGAVLHPNFAIPALNPNGLFDTCQQMRYNLVWPRLCQRWRLIETGLSAVAVGAFGIEALRYHIALQDAWQRFEGEPEDREALLALYHQFTDQLAWPLGFTRNALLKAYQLD